MLVHASRIILVLLIFNGFFSSYFLGSGKTIISKFKNCEQNENYKSVFNISYKMVDNLQYADGTFIFKAPIDNHIRTNISVETLIGKQYVYLFSVTERKSCDALNKYLGELWYDIERCSQIIPELCPIAMGRYHLHNCLINFDKMTTLSLIAFGQLRFTLMAYDSKNNLFTCIFFK